MDRLGKFPERLRDIRLSSGLDQEQLSGMLGREKTAVIKWEKGTTAPNIPCLLRLASALCVSVDYLVGFTDLPDLPAGREKTAGPAAQEGGNAPGWIVDLLPDLEAVPFDRRELVRLILAFFSPGSGPEREDAGGRAAGTFQWP
jgi:transcriptional regulator with XRE-family HTH domain